MAGHTHQLVFVGRIQGDYGGDYPLYWCRDCGTLIERLSGGDAELLPVTAKHHTNAPVKYDAVRLLPMYRRLGTGLAELMADRPTAKKLPGAG